MSSTITPTVSADKPKRQRRKMTEEEKSARRVAKLVAIKVDELNKAAVVTEVVAPVVKNKKNKSLPVSVPVPEVEVVEPPRKKRASKKTQTPPSVTVPAPTVNQTQAAAITKSNYSSFVLDVAKLLADSIIQGHQFNVYTSDDPQWVTVKDEVIKSAA